MAANINSAEGRIGGSAVAAKVNFGGHSAAGKLWCTLVLTYATLAGRLSGPLLGKRAHAEAGQG